MSDLDPTLIVLLATTAIGVAFGALGERSGFCLVSGVRDAVEGRSRVKLTAFVVAALVALAGTQALVATEAFGFGEVATKGMPYLPATASVAAVALGAFLLGLGAVVARGCPGRLTVLAATGHLRALVAVLVIAVIGYATMRGVLAFPRTALQGLAPVAGLDTDLGITLAALLGRPVADVRLGVAAVALAGAAALVLKVFRLPVVAALAIGALVPALIGVTAVIGAESFDPITVQGPSFVAPLGQTVVYAMTSTGAALDVPVLLVLGVLAGAGVSSLVFRSARLVGFDQPVQTVRSLGGAALMGFGGVLAIGCTAGQGLTGLATLAPLSVVAVIAMVAGIRLAIAVEARLAAPHRAPATGAPLAA